jgi:branched-chain amino acid aminotransferase
MSRIVWLNGSLVDPGRAAVSLDDPALRWGEGLFETMRARDGRVELLAAHLNRLERSRAALGLDAAPGAGEVRAALGQALVHAAGHRRVRVSVSAGPLLLVEVTPATPPPDAAVTVAARSLRGAWLPGARMAEHKTLSFAAYRWAARRAAEDGAGAALLTDADGRLGEGDAGNLFAVVAGEVLTAPVEGLLPGVSRQALLGPLGATERAPLEYEWRAAEELFLTNSVSGVTAVTSADGVPIGDGTVGRRTREAHDLLRQAAEATAEPPG